MRLISIDLGYSNVKICYYNEDGALQFDKYISAVAKIDNPMEIDNDVMFNLPGTTDTYVMGAASLKLSRNYLIDLHDYESLKNVYPVWISYILAKYGGIDSFDHVIIGLSLAFSDKADDLLEHLYDTLMIQKENYFYVLPQALSCKLGYSLKGLDITDTKTGATGSTELQNYIILDGGFYTLDWATVLGSKASAGAAIGIKDSGVIQIVYNIIDYLFKTYQMKVSLKEGQNILDNEGVFVRRGRKYDISDKVREFTKKYIGDVFNLLETNAGDSMDSSDGIICVGGLAYFLGKYENDPEVLSEIEKHVSKSFIHYPTHHAEFYNAFSYLKAGEKMLGLI